MSSNIEDLRIALENRDRIEQKHLALFSAFTIASQRASQIDNGLSKQEPPVSELHLHTEDDHSSPPSNQDVVDRLKESRKNLERQLRTLQSQLDQAQERARAVAEEQYLKTHVVQGLHDEILALSMQLNLSEEKRKKLQDELGR